jgi:uncharacterized protein (DUF433 family)
MQGTEIFGQGAYTLSQAARFIKVAPQRLRRWVYGYKYIYKRNTVKSSPVWSGDYSGVKKEELLSFRDMIEARFIIELRSRGISWKTIRAASEHAKLVLNTSHPFSSRRIGTMGKSVFAKVNEETGTQSFVNLVTKCYALNGILDKYIQDLEYSGSDNVIRWYPLHDRRKVVLDPARQFGQPIVAKEGVETTILFRAFQAEKSVERVAYWYDVSIESVRSAITFEKLIAA